MAISRNNILNSTLNTKSTIQPSSNLGISTAAVEIHTTYNNATVHTSYNDAVAAASNHKLQPGEIHIEFFIENSIYHCLLAVGNIDANKGHLYLSDVGNNLPISTLISNLSKAIELNSKDIAVVNNSISEQYNNVYNRLTEYDSVLTKIDNTLNTLNNGINANATSIKILENINNILNSSINHLESIIKQSYTDNKTLSLLTEKNTEELVKVNSELLTLKDELKAINANYAEKTESLEKTVNTLESTSAALKNDLYIILHSVQDLTSGLNQNVQGVNKLTEEQAKQSNAIAELSSKLSIAYNAISTINSNINTINSSINATNVDTNTFKSQQASQDSLISKLQSDINNIVRLLSTVGNNSIDSYKLAELEVKINSLTTLVAVVTNVNAELNEKLIAVETVANRNQQEVDKLANKISDNTSEIIDLTATTALLTEKVKTINTVVAEITTLNSSIFLTVNEINVILNDITNNQLKLNTNIEELKNVDVNLQQQIDELKALNNDTVNTVLNQNSIIASLQNNVDTLNNNQATLQNELSALNSSYATQEKVNDGIKKDISKLSDTVNNNILTTAQQIESLLSSIKDIINTHNDRSSVVNSSIANILTELEELNEKVDNIKSGIATDDTITSINASVNLIEQTLAELKDTPSNIANINSSIDSIYTTIDGLNASTSVAVKNIDASIAELTSKVDSNISNISNIYDSINSNNAKVSNIESVNTAQQLLIENLIVNINNLATLIIELQNVAASLEQTNIIHKSDIDSINVNITDIIALINALKLSDLAFDNKILQVNDSLVNLTAVINNNANNISGVASQTLQNTDDIIELKKISNEYQNLHDRYNQNIIDLQDTTSSMQTSMSVLGDSIIEINLNISKIQADLSSISAQVVTNTGDITTLTNKQNEFSREINNINRYINRNNSSINLLELNAQKVDGDLSNIAKSIDDINVLLEVMDSSIYTNYNHINIIDASIEYVINPSINELYRRLGQSVEDLNSKIDQCANTDISDSSIEELFASDVHTVNLCCYTDAGYIKISDSYPTKGEYRTYVNGDSVELTAVTNPGYLFNRWDKDNTFMTTNTQIALTFDGSDFNVKGIIQHNEFEKPLKHGYTAIWDLLNRLTYDISIYVDEKDKDNLGNAYIEYPEGDTLKFYGEFVDKVDLYYMNGATIAVEAMPIPQHIFKYYIVDGDIDNPISNPKLTFGPGQTYSSHHIIAVFEEIRYAIYAEPNIAEAGSIKMEYDPYIKYNNNVLLGTIITLTALENDGYKFDKWVTGVESGEEKQLYSNVRTITVIANDTIIPPELNRTLHLVAEYSKK